MDWDALTQFLLLERRWAPATVEQRSRGLKLAQAEGLQLETLTIESAKAYLTRRLMSGATPAAMNNTAKGLKAVLEWRGLDSKALRLQKTAKSHYKCLTESQVAACLNYRCLPKKREAFRRALLLLCLKTGLRLGELSALDLKDVDRSTEPNRLYVGKPTKRGAKRWIPVEPWVFSPRRALHPFLNGPRPRDQPSLLLFNGLRPTRENIRSELQQVSRDLGFRVSCTITRHTRATELRRSGWDLLALQHYLGHANISSTAVYAAVTPDDLQRLMATNKSRDPWASRRKVNP